MSAEGNQRKPKEGKLKEWNLNQAEGIGTHTNLAFIRKGSRKGRRKLKEVEEARGSRKTQKEAERGRRNQKRTEGIQRKLKEGSKKLKEVQKKTEGSGRKRREAEGS